MYGYFLVNKNGEYLKEEDTANSKLEFTTDVSEAMNYDGMPGGGEWFSRMERDRIARLYKNEYGDRATSLIPTYKEW